MQKTNNKATMKRVLKYIRKYTPVCDFQGIVLFT